jgi:hypothetical protein
MLEAPAPPFSWPPKGEAPPLDTPPGDEPALAGDVPLLPPPAMFALLPPLPALPKVRGGSSDPLQAARVSAEHNETNEERMMRDMMSCFELSMVRGDG